MAIETKKAAPSGERKPKTITDKKRLSYLKMRFKEVREELASIKKEMGELKAKSGAAGKAKGAKPAADDDDED